MPSNNRAIAEKLVIQLGELADDLIRADVHPGDITFALATTLTLVVKMYGGGDVAAAKALVCETIDEIWRTDDEAEALRKSN